MGKKKFVGEDGKMYVAKVKKPLYKRVWFWIVFVIILIIFGSLFGGQDDKKSSEPASKNESKSSVSAKSSSQKNEEVDLKANFDKLTVGDLMTNGAGGANLAEVKALFGEPDTTSESTIEGISTKMMVWSSLKGGSLLSSFSASFANDLLVSKAITGLKVSKHAEISLNQFNSISTAGDFTEDQARNEFGEPDSISTTLINGQTQNLLSWTKYVVGDTGANFSITFDNNIASNKSQLNMK